LLYRPKVFISHSAKEQEAREFCQAIAAGLSASGFDVLWDANLPTSGAWRGAIDEWIWNCDAAILVLSVDAVSSRYVAYEAALLRQRWLHMKPRFELVPVWCPGVSDTTLVQNMGALQIAEIHTDVKLAQWPQPGGAASYQPEVLQLISRLNGVLQETQPRHEIEKLLILELEHGTLTDAALADIADAYQLPALPPGAKKDRAALLARALIDSTDPLGDPRFDRLRMAIPAMLAAMNSPKDRVPKIVKLAAPFCWVSPAYVAQIPGIFAGGSASSRAIGWVRKWPFSERMYLYRTFCTRSNLWIVAPSELSGSQAAFDHILACLGDKVCNDAGATVMAVSKRIKKLTGDGAAVFLILSADGIVDELLSQVRVAWPDLRIFLYTNQMSETELAAQFTDVQILEPALDENLEADARSGWGSCMKAAGWNSHQMQNLEEFDS
jgi:hypothetical protein